MLLLPPYVLGTAMAALAGWQGWSKIAPSSSPDFQSKHGRHLLDLPKYGVPQDTATMYEGVSHQTCQCLSPCHPCIDRWALVALPPCWYAQGLESSMDTIPI